jgi:benzoate/toluate 1,2-dioxygenase reductase subunit
MAEKRARVERIDLLAPQVRLVICAAVDPPVLDFKPGQFISLRCGESGDQRRSYTLLSSPARRDRFELLVKDVPGGLGTSYFAALAPGDELHFTGPMGFFVPDAAHAGDVVLVATGAGIAGALPLAEAIAPRAEPGRVRLEWGLLDGQPTYLVDRLDALAQRAPRFSWTLHRAPDWIALHAALETVCVGALPGLAAPSFYLVGNGDMCRRVRDALVAAGVDRRKNIHNELFYPVTE